MLTYHFKIISAVDKPKFMYRPLDHPWLKTGSAKSFLGCSDYFDLSLKKFFFQLLTQNLHVFCLLIFPLIEIWVAHRATLGNVGLPDSLMGHIWLLGDRLSTTLDHQAHILSFNVLLIYQKNSIYIYEYPEGYEEWHPHNWPVTTTDHLPPHLANYLGHQRVSVFV